MFDAPSPPQWLNDASLTFLKHVAEPMYWLLLAAGLLAYLVLRWQQRPRESHAARSLRWRELGKASLWLALALGRVFGEWQLIFWAGAVLVVLAVTIWWVFSLYLTYIVPARRNRTAVVSDMLPPYSGPNDRRSGIERRSGWPTS